MEDERTVVDRLLAHHPHAEDKIGCGLESIMVRSYLRLQLQFAWLILLGCIEVRSEKEPNDIRFMDFFFFWNGIVIQCGVGRFELRTSCPPIYIGAN